MHQEKQAANKESPEDFRSVLYSVDRSGRRKWLYVDIARGMWRTRRTILAVFLIAFYLLLPFISFNGLPLLRIDIPNRSYTLLGQVFWPQDLSYALMFLILGIIGTVLMVSLCGRVFCGWFCPHNVFLEMVFRPLERLFEGPAHRHRHQDQKKIKGRFARKTLKYLSYFIVAGALANAATAVFVGTDPFIADLLINPVEHPNAAVFYLIFLTLIIFNFVWFREQTCTLVCPYGRLQTALLDSDTLTVAYNPQRGEPRVKKNALGGDCIDCKRCIQVCPTGIDIRNGNQLECIHCTACIDACDAVMDRLGRNRGLISYCSENELKGGRRRMLRPRTMLYAVVFLSLLVVTVLRVYHRPQIEIVQLRQNIAPQIISMDRQEYVQMMLKLSFVNKSTEDKLLQVEASDLNTQLRDVRIITQFNPLPVPAQQRREQVFYLRIHMDDLMDVKNGDCVVDVIDNTELCKRILVQFPQL